MPCGAGRRPGSARGPAWTPCWPCAGHEREQHPVQREPDGQEHDVPADERPEPEDPQRYERARHPRLDHDEQREQDCRPYEHSDRAWVAPAGLRGGHDGEDEEHEGGRDGQSAADVEVAQRTAVAALAHQQRAEHHQHDDDRHVDQEHRLPAEARRQQPTDEQPGRRAEPTQPAPDGERLVALGTLGERRHHQRERSGRHDRGREPLHRPRREQHGRRPRQPADQRREPEQRQPCDEDPAPAEEVGHAPAEQHQAAEGQGVAGEHPLHDLDRHPQVGLHRRHGRQHDRRVEDDHEEGGAEHRQRPPAQGVGRSLPGADDIGGVGLVHGSSRFGGVHTRTDIPRAAKSSMSSGTGPGLYLCGGTDDRPGGRR
jgi:hypothetical protein